MKHDGVVGELVEVGNRCDQDLGARSDGDNATGSDGRKDREERVVVVPDSLDLEQKNCQLGSLLEVKL